MSRACRGGHDKATPSTPRRVLPEHRYPLPGTRCRLLAGTYSKRNFVNLGVALTVVKGSMNVTNDTMRESKKGTSRIKQIRLWIRQVVRWSIGGLLVFGLILSPAIFVLPIYLDLKVFECAEQHLRAVGLLFQIVGFLLVAVNFNRILRLFQKPSFFAQISSYFKSFPSLRAKQYFASAQPLSVKVSAGTPRVRVRLGPGSSIQQRVQELEARMDSAENEMSGIHQNIDNVRIDTRKSMEELEAKNEQSNNRTNELVEQAIAGGMHSNWVGIYCFVVGVSLATMAPEVSSLLIFNGNCAR